MLDILFWISMFTGGILLILFLLSLIGGLDLDIEAGDTDVDGSGGIGLIKGALTFISISSWVFRILLIYNQPRPISLLGGILAGIVAVYLLSKLFVFLLNQQEFNEWTIEDSLGLDGKVYLKIPPAQKGTGIVQVLINGSLKDLKATTLDTEEIPTGSSVKVVDVDQQQVVIERI